MPSRPWSDEALPDDVTRVPAMLSHEERQYLAWLTRTQWQGWGAVVDLGPWVGASSVALAHGIRGSTCEGVVHSFDLFEWDPSYMEQHLAEGLGPGADFQHVFARETREYADEIRAAKLDLYEPSWTGGPIEILFVDAAKSWGLTQAILAFYGRYLVAGETRVVLQDHRHSHTYWLPLIFDGHPTLWNEVESTFDGDTVTFVPSVEASEIAGRTRGFRDEDYDFDFARSVFERRAGSEDNAANRAVLAATLYRYALRIARDPEIEGALTAALDVRLDGRDGAPGLVADLVHRAEDLSCWELYLQATEAFEAGRLADAEALMRRAARSSRYTGRCEALASRVAAMRGRHAAAARHLRRAVDAGPADSNAALYRAPVLLEHEQFSEAAQGIVDAMRHARALRPNEIPWAFGLLERILDRSRDEELARRVLDALRPSFADSADFISFDALVAWGLGDRDRAKRILETARAREIEHERLERVSALLG